MNVAVLGASNKPERYSYQAVKLLAEKGHAVFPIHPAMAAIDGVPAFKQLADISGPIHTLTMYVGPDRSSALTAAILAAKPRRVIFNPGSENPDLAQQLQAAGIEVSHACTLVLLRTGQFNPAETLPDQKRQGDHALAHARKSQPEERTINHANVSV